MFGVAALRGGFDVQVISETRSRSITACNIGGGRWVSSGNILFSAWARGTFGSTTCITKCRNRAKKLPIRTISSWTSGRAGGCLRSPDSSAAWAVRPRHSCRDEPARNRNQSRRTAKIPPPGRPLCREWPLAFCWRSWLPSYHLPAGSTFGRFCYFASVAGRLFVVIEAVRVERLIGRGVGRSGARFVRQSVGRRRNRNAGGRPIVSRDRGSGVRHRARQCGFEPVAQIRVWRRRGGRGALRELPFHGHAPRF